MFQRHGKNCVPRNSLSGGDSAYLALPDRGDISRILSRRRASLSLGGDDTRAGGGDDGRRRCFLVPPLDSAAFVLPTRPPTFPPTADPHQRSLRTSLSLSLSLYVHIHGGENTHTPIFSMCRRVRVPRIFPAMPVNSQARRGVQRERERKGERARKLLRLFFLFPPLADIFSLRGSRSTARTEHTRRYLGGVRLRRKGDPRSGYRPTLAPSPAFSHRIPHQARDQPLSTANVDTRRTPDRSSCLSRPGPGAQYRECYGGRTGREKEFNRCAQSSWSVLLLLSRPLSSRFSRTEHSARILMVVTFFHASSYNNHGKRETSERSEEKSASIDCLPICPPSSSFQDESRRKILPENRSNFSPHLEMYVRIRPHVNDTRPLVVSLHQTTARISFEKKLVQYYIDSFDAKEGEAIPSQDLLLPSPPPTIGARSPGFRLSKSSKRARVFSRVAANRTKSRSRIG